MQKKHRFSQINLRHSLEIIGINQLNSISNRGLTIQDLMENGAGLGWLINPQQQQVFIYQPKKSVVILERPKFLTDDLLLVGFKLEMRVIWDVEF